MLSFCKTPPYVSSLGLKRTQMFMSHAASRLGKRKPSSSPSWPPWWFAPNSGAGDRASVVSDVLILSKIHSALLASSLARPSHPWLRRARSAPSPMGPTHPRADSPGNQPHPTQADPVSCPVQFHTILLEKSLESSFSSLIYPVNAFIQAYYSQGTVLGPAVDPQMEEKRPLSPPCLE